VNTKFPLRRTYKFLILSVWVSYCIFILYGIFSGELNKSGLQVFAFVLALCLSFLVFFVTNYSIIVNDEYVRIQYSILRVSYYYSDILSVENLNSQYDYISFQLKSGAVRQIAVGNVTKRSELKDALLKKLQLCKSIRIIS
jgi:hypothetical protein